VTRKAWGVDMAEKPRDEGKGSLAGSVGQESKRSPTLAEEDSSTVRASKEYSDSARRGG